MQGILIYHEVAVEGQVVFFKHLWGYYCMSPTSFISTHLKDVCGHAGLAGFHDISHERKRGRQPIGGCRQLVSTADCPENGLQL